MRQQAEWLPNGRTTLAFDAATGEVLGARDALKLAPGAQAFNKAFPIHASQVGGWAWRSLLPISGLSLALLGSFAVRSAEHTSELPSLIRTPYAVLCLNKKTQT